MGTATALVPTTVLRIQKGTMMRTLREQSTLSDRFIAAHARSQHPDRRGPHRSAVQLE
jgi:hypothetical protein